MGYPTMCEVGKDLQKGPLQGAEGGADFLRHRLYQLC